MVVVQALANALKLRELPSILFMNPAARRVPAAHVLLFKQVPITANKAESLAITLENHE
jgi:hypothetical protein